MKQKGQQPKNIVYTQRLGELLRNKRAERDLSFAQVADATHIRVSYLQALEAEDYNKFSSAVHAKGILKNYAQHLGLDTNKVLALYRRDSGGAEEVKRDLTLLKPTKRNLRDILLSTRTLLVLGMVLILVIFGGYLASQVSALLQPPLLKLISPLELAADFDGEIYLPGNSFKIQGETAPQTVVRLNSEPLPLQGFEFESGEIPFKGDEMSLLLTATNQFGRISTIKLHIKKGSTGVAKADEMSILISVQDQAVDLLVRTDGVIQFNDRGFAGDVIALNAKTRLQIESDAPYALKVTINGQDYTFTARDQIWELIGGEVLQQ